MSTQLANVDAEQVVLGSILLSPNTSSVLVDALEVSDFANEHHRSIFETIKSTVANGKPPHPVLMAPELRAFEIAELKINCAQYCGRLLTAGVTVADAKHYASHLRGYSSRRQVSEIAAMLAEAAVNPSANVAEFALEAINGLDAITTTARGYNNKSSRAGDIALQAIAELKSGKKEDILPTGLKDLDRVIGGLQHGKLMFIAGRPSMGKSAFLFSLARQSARKGAKWLIFSLEMSRKDVVARMLSDMVWNRENPITYEKIVRGDLTPFEIERVEMAARKLSELDIEIDDQPGLTAADIAIRSRRHAEKVAKSGGRLNAIGIDHLGKVAAGERYAGNRVHETGEKTNAFAVLGKELNTAMAVAHQLNRGNEKRENKRPELADLRDSGDVEQDADIVLFPFRLSYYLERMKEDDSEKDLARITRLEKCRNLIEVNAAKNRGGQCRNIEFFCDMGSNVIRDAA